MHTRLDAIRQQLEVLEVRVPEIIESVRERYQARMQDLIENLDPARVARLAKFLNSLI